MKRTLIILALLPLQALAQSPPSCWLVTTAKGYTMGAHVHGQYAAWWCPDAWGDWRLQLLVMRNGYMLLHPPVPASATQVQRLEIYWRANVNYHCGVPTGNDPAMLALCDAARNAGIETLPLPPYTVRSNGSSPTRPTYPLVNGVRSSTSNGTVPVRDIYGRPTACNSAQRVGDYMQVKRTPGTVALCGASS